MREGGIGKNGIESAETVQGEKGQALCADTSGSFACVTGLYMKS